MRQRGKAPAAHGARSGGVESGHGGRAARESVRRFFGDDPAGAVPPLEPRVKPRATLYVGVGPSAGWGERAGGCGGGHVCCGKREWRERGWSSGGGGGRCVERRRAVARRPDYGGGEPEGRSARGARSGAAGRVVASQPASGRSARQRQRRSGDGRSWRRGRQRQQQGNRWEWVGGAAQPWEHVLHEREPAVPEPHAPPHAVFPQQGGVAARLEHDQRDGAPGEARTLVRPPHHPDVELDKAEGAQPVGLQARAGEVERAVCGGRPARRPRAAQLLAQRFVRGLEPHRAQTVHRAAGQRRHGHRPRARRHVVEEPPEARAEHRGGALHGAVQVSAHLPALRLRVSTLRALHVSATPPARGNAPKHHHDPRPFGPRPCPHQVCRASPQVRHFERPRRRTHRPRRRGSKRNRRGQRRRRRRCPQGRRGCCCCGCGCWGCCWRCERTRQREIQGGRHFFLSSRLAGTSQ
mmetsp:Transcript_11604/g.23027  ORF Transcript_11604/g.23027 Transcript_11604/m.23027 type:complete len:466 (+) Transcript_11604:300-1697(+)